MNSEMITGEIAEDGLASRAATMFSAYRAGDQDKMADLVKLLTPILWHTVRAMRLDSATSEDIVQTVWLVLVRKAETVSEPRAVLQWLIVTARREAWRVARSQARSQPEDFHNWEPEVVQTNLVEDEVLRADTQAKLWKHIQTLPDRCRTLLRVIAFADRPDYALLAEALGMPQGSIGPTRGRCLAKLRIALSDDPTWQVR